MFTDSSNLRTFLIPFNGLSFNFTSFSAIESMILASCLEAKIFFNLGFVDSDLHGVGGGGEDSHLGLEMTCLCSGQPLHRLWLLPTGSVPCLSCAYVYALHVYAMRPLS